MRQRPRILLLVCLTLTSGLITSLNAQTGARRHAASPSGAIQQLYATLASASMTDEKVLFRSLTPSVRSALWSYHLSLFLREHPTLSAEQLAVIAEAVAQA